MRSSSWLGLLLVVGGAVYLLSIVHLIHLPPVMWSSDTIWGLILVALGLAGLRGFQRTIPWSALFLLLYGVFLFLRNSMLVPRLTEFSATGVFWSLLLIYLGISVFAPKRLGGWKPKVVIKTNDGHVRRVEGSFREVFGDFKDWRPKAHQTRHWLGDVSLGSEPWALEDMSVWNGIGDVRVNLATAHLEDKTYHIAVEGWIGDVRILVPPSIPVCVQADVNIGDVNVFEHAESGTGRSVSHKDVTFDAAVRRVLINIQLKIGDVQIVRV